ncbi:melatonin receptor type 1A [Diabrotica virgifera virgifera]|uniref:Melatonin receptor type 1A-like n=1 Tax=Diabrotica virgifera virgifera TaxID=50390 RepID=A0A6P7F9X8_DIAVI|nr:melatonin receptor type 1A [Diabrotica virgifera virgifera]
MLTDDDSDLDNLDVSHMPFINTIWTCKNCTEVVLKTSAVLPVVAFGIFGNIMVIYILWKNLNLRTATNLLIGNMAVADLLSLLIHPWVMLTLDLFQNYQLGVIGCKGEGPVECSLLIASVVSMSAVTYDRLTAIVLPRETRITKKGAKTLIALMWIFGLLLSLPMVFNRAYKERKWLNFLEKYCTENLIVSNMYWYVIVAILVWLPMTIQLICYISIFIKLDKYEKITVKTLNKQHTNYKKKAAITMFIVTVVFMICRLPFTAYIIFRHQLFKEQKLTSSSSDIKFQLDQSYYILWCVSKYLIFVNSAINPLIYGVTNEKFLREFKSTKIAKIFCGPCMRTAKSAKRTKSSEEANKKYKIFIIFKRKYKPQIKEELEEPPTPIKTINTQL